MGTIYKRGTRANPRASISSIATGRLTSDAGTRRTRPPLRETLEDARKQVALVETRIAQELPPFPNRRRRRRRTGSRSDCKRIARVWKSLANWNAADDRSRMDRHIIPTFVELSTENVALAAVMRPPDEVRKAALSGQTRRHLSDSALPDRTRSFMIHPGACRSRSGWSEGGRYRL
jgi:hypothetical protein